MTNRKRIALCLAAGWLLAGIALTLAGARTAQASNYSAKLEAARLAQVWIDAVRERKLQAGLELSEEDFHRTGLIGARYTALTTTLGNPAAKRTTCNPDMAALVVELLDQAGVQPGDTVGASFSGSFPGMNLAVLAACQALDVNCVYIASVGSSAYGANQPELTFPEMVCRLHQAQLLERGPSLVTPGGDYDCGEEMDPELRDQVLAKIEAYGVPILREPDYPANLAARMEVYDREGPIRCFIGVGGNIATLGLDDEEIPCGLLPAGQTRSVTEKSGLIRRYNALGLPAIHLLDIKKLVADYGMPFDPERLPPLGESAIYYETVYPKGRAALCLAAAAGTIWLGFHGLRRRD